MSASGQHSQQTSSTRRWPKRVLVIGGATVAGLLVVGGAVAALEWPHAALASGRTSLGVLSVSGAQARVSDLRLEVDGRSVPATMIDGRILPTVKLPTGAAASITVTLERPSWIAWLAGRTQTIRLVERTPRATLLDPVAISSTGQPVRALFSSPVSEIVYSLAGTRRTLHLAHAVKGVALLSPSSAPEAGDLSITAAPEPWETLPSPSRMVFFQASSQTPVAVVSPRLNDLAPEQSLSFAFSRPISALFGSSHPTISPVVAGADPVRGTWTATSDYSLTFTPTQPDFWPGESFTLTFPTKIGLATGNGKVASARTTYTLTGMPIPYLRLQELLADLGYLPVSFTPSGPHTALTTAAQVAAIESPPSGTFTWRWTMPSELTSLWSAGTDNVITQGAVMSFEDFNGLDYSNGLANPLLWPTLVKDVLAHKSDPHSYTWIQVRKVLPETLFLWKNGKVVLTSLANTGIPGYATTNGTFPIYLRFPVNWMNGTNPNGTHYHDLVHWINYFHGGEAVHGFVRASYGFRQSLGCVELPVPVAAEVYPQVHIGTLVTVEPA